MALATAVRQLRHEASNDRYNLGVGGKNSVKALLGGQSDSSEEATADQFPLLSHGLPLLKLLLSRSIESVALEKKFLVKFPCEIFGMLPKLKHLKFLSDFSIFPPSPPELLLPDPSATVELIELESLGIGGYNARGFVEFLAAHTPIRLSRLRNLSLCGPWTDILWVGWDIISRVKATIASLTFDYRFDPDLGEEDDQNPPHGPIDLHNFQHLRFLTFRLQDIIDDYQFMASLLRQSGLPPNLEELNIHMELGDEWTLIHGGAGADCAVIMDRDLSSVLSDPERPYPQLHSIQIRLAVRLNGDIPHGQDEEDIYNALLGHVPSLHGTGKLSVMLDIHGRNRRGSHYTYSGPDDRLGSGFME